MAPTAARRRYRIEMRVTEEQDALIRQAADLEDTSVTAFIIDAVSRRARKVLKDHETVLLSNEVFDRFLAELDEPARPVPELRSLFERYEPFPE